MSIKGLIPWKSGRSESVKKRHSEEGELLSLKREMNRLFEDFWRDGSLFSSSFWSGPWGGLRPYTDFSETSDEVTISLELPGVDEKNIEVNLGHGTLTIKGEKVEEEREGVCHRIERSYGSFYRSFSVPDDVDENRVEAFFKNGILKIRLPKTIEAKMAIKKVPVKAA